ncbi:MAG: hypothetical protein OXE79_02240 [Acidimicrobiaceae bacterium]|nr:hypothetical protein [Acidimicrobiaceae bacterium]MCY4175268.1 hypothetical protein [Acidimicrobiaceae bacterium]MCY4279222.1 hypothetical protein [Acidimicrobiaceae bacterium]MCY4293754.1 hypothetical protein [Acidimicrobiaceae bacterium]
MSEVTFRLHAPDGGGVADAAILASYPNGTYRTGFTDSAGDWLVDLYRVDQQMTILAAAEGHMPLRAAVVPDEAVVDLSMAASTNGCRGVLFTKSTGCIPGIEGRLNPINDGRTYVYAGNIAINGRVANPAMFEVGERLHLTDVYGVETVIRFLEVTAQFSLIEFTEPRPFEAQP